MTPHPAPKLSRAPAFPLIWVVPIIAAMIGLFMVVREIRDRGPLITIQFTDGSGVEAGRTILEYKGVAVGTVKAVNLSRDLKTAIIQLQLKKEAAPLANTGSKFWILHPEVGFSGVHGLDTLVSGVRLNVRPGSGSPATQFKGLDQEPPPEQEGGRTFFLKSDKLGSLTTGSPILYRQFKVGEVEASRLADDSTSVVIRIHIDPTYMDLVRTNTRFWNAGGFSFKIGLLGAALKESSLESLVSGGVGLASPGGKDLGPPAPAGAQFDMASEAEREWLTWSPAIPIKSQEVMPAEPDKQSLVPRFLKP